LSCIAHAGVRASVRALSTSIENLTPFQRAPVINVVAAALTIAAIIPVWLAQRFGGDPAGTRI
jgi:hypothetical protein